MHFFFCVIIIWRSSVNGRGTPSIIVRIESLSQCIFIAHISLHLYLYNQKCYFFFFLSSFWAFLFRVPLLFPQQSILPLLVPAHYHDLPHKLLFLFFLRSFTVVVFFDLLKIEPVAATDIVENAVLLFVCKFLVLNCFWQILEFFSCQIVVFLSILGLFLYSSKFFSTSSNKKLICSSLICWFVLINFLILLILGTHQFENLIYLFFFSRIIFYFFVFVVL